MTKENVESLNNTAVDDRVSEDTVIFISTEEDEQEGNFEFLCCGSMGVGGGGIGGRW